MEVSWNPPYSVDSTPLDLNITVTGYRIFFDNGENVSLPSIVTSVSLLIDEVMVGQQIFIRTEAAQEPPSELVNVTVTRSSKCEIGYNYS